MRSALRPANVVVATAAVFLLLVGTAMGCGMALRETGPVLQSDVRLPIRHETVRPAWGLQPGWVSIRPEVAQGVRVAGRPEGLYGVVHRKQETFTLMALDRRGTTAYHHDDDPATRPCALDGLPVWTRPRLLTRETPRAVFVTFATRRTGGDRTGCVVGPGRNPCGDIAIGSVTLEAPLGDRRFVRTWFSA